MWSVRLRFGVASLLALLTACSVGGLGLPRASAAVACRSDPVLVVNGSIVDVVSELQTTASAVRELDYTITVPSGSLLGPIRLTIGLGFPEKVTYVFSKTQAWGTMQIAASVVTQAGVSPFPTTVQATSLLAGAMASGLSNQTVVVMLGKQIML